MGIPAVHDVAPFDDLVIFGLSPSHTGRVTRHVVIVCKSCYSWLEVGCVRAMAAWWWSLSTVGDNVTVRPARFGVKCLEFVLVYPRYIEAVWVRLFL